MAAPYTDTIPGTAVTRGLAKDDLIVITGAGGFIAGSLTRYFAGSYALWTWAAVSLLILPFMRSHRRVD